MALKEMFSAMDEFARQYFTTTGILIAICVVLSTLVVASFHGSLLSGPGPWGVPIFGYYPFLKNSLHLQLLELSKKYGPVYKLNICGQTYLYLGSFKVIREAQIAKSEEFAYRSNQPIVFGEGFQEGLVAIKGEHWKVIRKFTNQCLREIGLTGNKGEHRGLIENVVQSIIDVLSKSKGNPLDIVTLFTEETTKSVASLFLGEDVADEDIKALTYSYFDLFTPFVDANLLLAGAVAKYVISPWIKDYSKFHKGVKDMNRVLHKIVDQRKSALDPSLQPTNFVDAFLRERALREKKGDPTAKYFTDQCLVSTLMQAYGDGSTGIGLFISTYIVEICKQPDVQNAIYEEISTVVGTERLPTLDDRSKLPYTTSAIKEVLRRSSLFPIFPGLECIRDTTVQGVKVPKGSVVVLNYWAAHHDPEVYKNPEVFDATRFLPDKPKVENPITFGVGKRSCAGEGLVMTQLFLLFSAIFQNFTVTLEDNTVDMSSVFHSSDGKCYVRANRRS